MTEIQFSSEIIPLPKTTKIEIFLQELQKRTTNGCIFYLIDRKEIGVFQSMDEIKTGLFKRLKPSDSLGHYFYDTEKDHEIVIFHDKASEKIGNFPLDRPTKKGFGFDPSRSIQSPIPNILPQNQPPPSNQPTFGNSKQNKNQNQPQNPYANSFYNQSVMYNQPPTKASKSSKNQQIIGQQSVLPQTQFNSMYPTQQTMMQNGYPYGPNMMNPQPNMNSNMMNQNVNPQMMNQQSNSNMDNPIASMLGPNFLNRNGGYTPIYNNLKTPKDQNGNMNPQQIENRYAI